MQARGTRRKFWRGQTAWFAALLLLCAGTANADAPADALKAVADATAALVNDDSLGFLDQFDHNMPGFAALRANVEGLLNASNVGSTVDVITNDGDDAKRTLTLDWVLVLSAKDSNTGGKETQRGVVKCQVERRGKSWKITMLEPVEFFKR
jgi:hypothetical protein